MLCDRGHSREPPRTASLGRADWGARPTSSLRRRRWAQGRDASATASPGGGAPRSVGPAREPLGRARRREAWRIDRQTEVRQDLLDHPAVIERRHQTQAAPTGGAGEPVDRKGPAQQIRPRAVPDSAQPRQALVGGRQAATGGRPWAKTPDTLTDLYQAVPGVFPQRLMK